MAFIHLKSGVFESSSKNELDSIVPQSLTRRALLVYEGEFESMDGPVKVGQEELTKLATEHNTLLEAVSKLSEGKESMKDFPPVQLDHSTSAKDTVGRLVGKVDLAPYKTKDGKDVMGAYGNVRILGAENVVKIMDGRWTHLSVGVDFEKGKFSELTITPFPAAPEASLLSKLKSKISAKTLVELKEKALKEMNWSMCQFKKCGSGIWEVYTGSSNPQPYRVIERGGEFVLELTESKLSESNPQAVQYKGKEYLIEARGKFPKLEYYYTISGEKSVGPFMSASEAGIAARQAITDALRPDLNQMSQKRMGDAKLPGVMKDEALWEKAKRAADEAGADDKYAFAMWRYKEHGGQLSSKDTEMSKKNKVKKLSEGDKSMDKDKMKKHLMDKEKLSEKDAEEKLAKCTEDEMKKMAAEVEEEEKKMAQEKAPSEKEMEKKEEEKDELSSEEKVEDEKKMSEEEDEEKAEMASEEHKKEELAEKEDEEKKEEEEALARYVTKMSRARESITKLSSDFRKSFDNAQLAAKKGKIVSRLSALKASAKITPAEIKKINLSKMAEQPQETIDLVLKSYEDREPVVMTGALGSIKAGDLASISREIKMSRLEEETRKNMSLLKNTVKTKMQEGEKEGGEVSIHVDTTPHVDQEIEMAYGQICKMMDEGKMAEAKEMLKKYMNKPMGEGRMESKEQEEQMATLAEEAVKMQNKFEELQRLATSLVG